MNFLIWELFVRISVYYIWYILRCVLLLYMLLGCTIRTISRQLLRSLPATHYPHAQATLTDIDKAQKTNKVSPKC
jgi:hypothetical protein